MQPLNNFIVCKELEKEKKTGFIYTSNEKFEELEVIATSQENVKVGDVVKVLTTAGDKDEDKRIIRSTDIIYIV